MKKTFKLEGLDCASCASKIETAIQKIPGVNNATVNFMTTKMIIEGDDEKFSEIIENATSIVKKVDSDISIKKA